MSDRFFVDTNVLVYAHDRGSGVRHEQAKGLVRRLWENRTGVLSTQVLQEFLVSIRRKASRPVDADQARRILSDYLRWHIVVNDGNSVLEALDLELRYGISFWDALMLHAANVAGADVVYSEDLNHGQVYGAATVLNPFVV